MRKGNDYDKWLNDGLSESEITMLRRMKEKKTNLPSYRIVITGDRCDYDDLSELANHPERGKMIGIFHFAYPHELIVLVKAFEGLFYQLFAVDSDIRIGSGVLDDSVFDDVNNW